MGWRFTTPAGASLARANGRGGPVPHAVELATEDRPGGWSPGGYFALHMEGGVPKGGGDTPRSTHPPARARSSQRGCCLRGLRGLCRADISNPRNMKHLAAPNDCGGCGGCGGIFFF